MWFNSEALATPLVLCTPSHASLHFAIFCACASTTLLVLHSICMWEEDCFSFKQADLVARLLNQSASLSSGSRSRSPPAPTRRLSEVMDESSLRQVIQTEVTACVAAAVQNLPPSLHLPTASATLSPNVTPHGSAPSSSTDLGPDLQLIAPTTTTTMAAALPTATVPARTVDRIIRGEYIDSF